MKQGRRKHRLFWRVLILLTTCCVIWFASRYYVLQALHSSGITFSKKDFHFPSGLTVEGFDVDRPGLNVHADTITIDWSWSSLFNNHLKGERLRIANLLIKKWNAPDSLASLTSGSAFNLPVIQYDFIDIVNARIDVVSGKDTTLINAPELHITGLAWKDAFHVDSLFNRQCVIVMNSQNTKETDSRTNEDFSIRTLPAFSADWIGFEDCTFIQGGDQHQEINHIDVKLAKLNKTDELRVQSCDLSLTYHDTFDVQARMDSFALNALNETALARLTVSAPDASFVVNTLSFSDARSLEIKAEVEQASLTNRSIKTFFPGYDPYGLPDDWLAFNGNFHYHDEQLESSGIHADISGKSVFNLEGSIGFSDTDDHVDLRAQQVNTSLFEVARLAGFSLPDGQQNLRLRGMMDLAVTKKVWKVNANLKADNTPMRIKLNLDQTAQSSIAIAFNVQSPGINPSKLIAVAPEDIMLSGLDASGSLLLDAASNLSSASLHLQTDSLKASDHHFYDPDIRISYQPEISKLEYHNERDEISLRLQTTDDLADYNHLRFAGEVMTAVPSVTQADTITGHLYSLFQGQYSIADTTTTVRLSADTLRFIALSGKTFTTTGIADITYDTIEGISLDLAVGQSTALQLDMAPEAIAWLQDTDRFESAFPDMHLRGFAEIDSLFLREISGINAYMIADTIDLSASGDTVLANIHLPQLKWDDIILDSLDADLRYANHQLYSDFSLASLKNPYINLRDLRMNTEVRPDSVTALKMESILADADTRVAAVFLYHHPGDQYQLSIDEQADLEIGDRRWQVTDGEGILLNKDFEVVKSKVALSEGRHSLLFSYEDEVYHGRIDSFEIAPLVSLYTDQLDVTGDLNLDFNYQTKGNKLDCEGTITAIQLDSMLLGDITVQGSSHSDIIDLKAELVQPHGRAMLSVTKEEGPFRYVVDVRDFDLSYLHTYAGLAEYADVTGMANASITGSYGDTLQADGHIALRDIRIAETTYGVHLNVLNDTIWFRENTLDFRNFTARDDQQHTLKANGLIDFSKGPDIDLRLKSDAFRYIDQTDRKKQIYGHVAAAVDLAIKGPVGKPGITGTVRTTDDGYIHYTYGSTVSLDDRAKVINFTSFSDPKVEFEQQRKAIPRGTFDWDVDLVVGKTELYILIDEAVNDYAKLTAQGELQLKKGTGNTPLAYGSIKSTDGSVYYDAPMISDLQLNILKASVDWKGDLFNPTITFKGTEVFRISAADVPGAGGNAHDRIPVNVLAVVDNSSLDNFVIHFDLESNDASLGSFLQAQTPENRETYAMNLLLFGSMAGFSGPSAGASMMSSVVSKLNEISRRNLTKADLSFYVDSESAYDSPIGEINNKFGYAYTQGFFNKKIKVTLDGKIDLSGNTPIGSKAFNPLGTIQLEYILKEKPYLSLVMARKDTYKGVFDGQVTEASAGLNYKKNFPNLFKFSSKLQDK